MFQMDRPHRLELSPGALRLMGSFFPGLLCFKLRIDVVIVIVFIIIHINTPAIRRLDCGMWLAILSAWQGMLHGNSQASARGNRRRGFASVPIVRTSLHSLGPGLIIS
jgi:hypothetical protein